ncbi:hypothetical protein SOVF_123210, partial [Spinacia oleracea]
VVQGVCGLEFQGAQKTGAYNPPVLTKSLRKWRMHQTNTCLIFLNSAEDDSVRKQRCIPVMVGLYISESFHKTNVNNSQDLIYNITATVTRYGSLKVAASRQAECEQLSRFVLKSPQPYAAPSLIRTIMVSQVLPSL